MTSTPRQYAQPGTPPQGTLKIEGGTNAFTKMTNIGTVLLVGGVLQATTNPLAIGTLEQTVCAFRVRLALISSFRKKISEKDFRKNTSEDKPRSSLPYRPTL